MGLGVALSSATLMKNHRIHGLVAAPHTPFHADGSLNLAVIEKQAAHLLSTGVRRAFIGGTTGESHSLNILWGTDECLLAGLALGARGAVGSTYNFAAPIYQRVMRAFEANDLATARAGQMRSVQMIARIAADGYMASAKAVMKMLGVEVGPARLPHSNLDAAQVKSLRSDLEQMGFFEWVKPNN